MGDGADTPGLTRVGPVVILHGAALRTAFDTVTIATRARKLNGLPISAHHRALAQALVEAVAANGQVVAAAHVAVTSSILPAITVEEAAATLHLSRRQTRSLAPKLGGRIVPGRWLLDAQAIDEHVKGGWKRAAQHPCLTPCP
jgi:hypothetical protein